MMEETKSTQLKEFKASDDPTTTPTQAIHRHIHTGRRLRKLLRPNGRRVHIAATPEEHIHLKRYVCLSQCSNLTLRVLRPIELLRQVHVREYQPRLLVSGSLLTINPVQYSAKH